MSQQVIAVFGDIHSNLEALTAVLADMEAQSVTQRVCLGDIVGYAASPAKCLAMVRSLNCPIVQGNHDEAAGAETPLTGMRDLAKAGIEFSRKKLAPEERTFLKELPRVEKVAGCLFVHASLHNPGEWGYITDAPDAAEHFEQQGVNVCFCGHTHQPRVWSRSDSERPVGRNGQGTITLDRHSRYLINVGSVGQPRDLNANACYVIYDADNNTVEFRRVKYDVTKARRKISRAKLPKFLGQRLALGR